MTSSPAQSGLPELSPTLDALLAAAQQPREPAWLLRAADGTLTVEHTAPSTVANGVPPRTVMAQLPALYPEDLGGSAFTAAHGLRFAYVAGAMANGIATTELVVTMARSGCLGFFGAAGLGVAAIEAALDRLDHALAHTDLPWGSNLIHSPQEPTLEASVVDLYLRRGVRRVSASAFMDLQPSVVHYAATGLTELANGTIARRNFLFAKISRPEVAQHFLRPPPQRLLDTLVAAGKLTANEARLAAEIPVASDIIVESDSGGHTDNRPLGSLFPTIAALRDELQHHTARTAPVRLGAAGGIGTPDAVASAFSLGAAFVLTGSINQASLQSGLAVGGREMLAKAGLADVTMCAAADMFELGVKLQVLQRGTLFAGRANRLYELYTSYKRWADVPAALRSDVETKIFRADFAAIWAQTEAFWRERQPSEVTRAHADPRHKMALCFRWYLGKSSRWAIAGDDARRLDWQIWCGPAMGAFNRWVRGSFLEDPTRRDAAQIALNLLEGATVLTRARQLQLCGATVPPAAFAFAPRSLQ